MKQTLFALVAAAATTMAQRPTNTSICDYYTTALFKNNTAANQLALVTAVVTRAGVGNTTADPNLTGIVNKGTYNGKSIDLSGYFNGGFNSTNRGGSSGVVVNFLDGGSNQMTLFSHLDQYFGAVLGCSSYGKDAYPAYAGKASQYDVHKYMDLNADMVGYFNTQVGLSAKSFGVTDADVQIAATALNTLFNVRCAPPTTVIPAQGAQLQSICIDSTCPLSPNSTCSSYETVLKPVAISKTNGTTNGTTTGSNSTATSSSSMMGATASGTSTGSSSTSSRPAQQTTNAGSSLVAGGLVGAAALLFAL